MPPKSAIPAPPDPSLCPPSIKVIIPFIQRAAEVKSADPAIAYWCLYNAARLGLPLSKGREPEANTYIGDILKYLEATKNSLKGDQAVENSDHACERIEQFASRIFNNADNEDRSGQATRLTAKKFLAAANFMQLLGIFDREDSVRDKMKYAKWKAADIAKAFREGRVPQPGPAGGEPDLAFPDDDAASSNPSIHERTSSLQPIQPSQPPSRSPPKTVVLPSVPSSENLTPRNTPAATPTTGSPSTWSTVATPGPDYSEERRREGKTWAQDSPTPSTKLGKVVTTFADEQDASRGKPPTDDDGSEDDRGYWSTVSTPGVGMVDGQGLFPHQQGYKAPGLLPGLPIPVNINRPFPSAANVTAYTDPPLKGEPLKVNPAARRVHFTESTAGGAEDLNEPPPDSPVVELSRDQAELRSMNGTAAPRRSNLGPGTGARSIDGLPSVTEDEDWAGGLPSVPDSSLSSKASSSPPRTASGSASQRSGSSAPGSTGSLPPPSKPDSNALPPVIPTSQRDRRTSSSAGRGGPPVISGFDEKREKKDGASPVIPPPAPAAKKENSVPPTVPSGAPRERRNSLNGKRDGPPSVLSPPSQDNNLPPTVSSAAPRERRNSLTGGRPTGIGAPPPPPTGPPPAQGSRERRNSLLSSAPDNSTQFLAPPPPTVPGSASVPSGLAKARERSPSRPSQMPLPSSPGGSSSPSANTSPDMNNLPRSLPSLTPSNAGGQPPARASPPAPAPAPAPAPPGPPASLDPASIAQAQRHAKFAISALTYEDLDTARKELRSALAILGG